MRRSIRFSFFVVALLCALSGLMMACSRTPQQEASSQTSQEEEPTAAFRVDLPATKTSAQGGEEDPSQPTNTPGPTNTPRPTNTPWPTQAPTSAPVDDPGMVYVPGGEFIFGSDEGREEESPEQVVEIDGFNIDKHPVTCAEYKAFVDATGHPAPRDWEGDEIPEGHEEHPVVWVSWEDATAYCEWAGKRLPTEMEWEKAARGTEGNIYPWGNSFDASLCNSRESDIGETTVVDRFPEGATPYGALDMSGNVWEWTADWYDAYRGSVYELDRYGTTYRVLRGGSWYDGANAVRTTSRNSAKPGFAFSTIGFRCAR